MLLLHTVIVIIISTSLALECVRIEALRKKYSSGNSSRGVYVLNSKRHITRSFNQNVTSHMVPNPH